MSEVLARPEAESQPGTALAIIPPASLPTLVAVDTTDILGRLRAELAGYTPDASTEAGRAEIGSKAKKVGTAKQDFVRLAKTQKEDHQAVINKINAELKVIETNCDTIRDAILAPREEYLQRDKDRVAAHEVALAEIEILAGLVSDPTAAEIAERLAKVPAIDDRVWHEFHMRAERAIIVTRERLQTALAAAEKREAEAAELAQLRAAEADRQRKEAHRAALAAIEDMGAPGYGAEPTSADLRVLLDRLNNLPARDFQEFAAEADKTVSTTRDSLQKMLDAAVQREEAERKAREAQIAAEAAEQAKREAEAKAERDRLAADAKAKADQEAAERREQEALEAAARAEADRKAAEARAEREKQEAAARAERERQAAEERAQQEREAAARRERDALEAAQRAEAARKEAEARAERERIAAADRAEREKAEAIEAERQRQAAEAERVRQEDAKRAADLEHRRKINNEVVADLIAAGVSKTAAIEAVKAIAKGVVRHLRVAY